MSIKELEEIGDTRENKFNRRTRNDRLKMRNKYSVETIRISSNDIVCQFNPVQLTESKNSMVDV